MKISMTTTSPGSGSSRICFTEEAPKIIKTMLKGDLKMAGWIRLMRTNWETTGMCDTETESRLMANGPGSSIRELQSGQRVLALADGYER
jgi:hypothetical protein